MRDTLKGFELVDSVLRYLDPEARDELREAQSDGWAIDSITIIPTGRVTVDLKFADPPTRVVTAHVR